MKKNMKYPCMCVSGLDFVSVEVHLFACDGQISIQLMNPSFNRDGLSSSSHKIIHGFNADGKQCV